MRAGQALRDKWAAEARREARARDPRLAAQDKAEAAAMKRRITSLSRYGAALRRAMEAGELTIEEVFSRYLAAEERTYQTLSRARDRIFGR